ncbi:hypothetical protein POUND7_006772 [Theobroma cacao]
MFFPSVLSGFSAIICFHQFSLATLHCHSTSLITILITVIDIVAAAVHSGNHTFESRVHPLTRDNYLASPPLVAAYALAGTDDIDFEKEPIGTGKDGKSVYFRDIWPSNEEIAELAHSSVMPDMFKSAYVAIRKGNPMWNQLAVSASALHTWDPN